jgi:hypothetical protein
VTVQRGTGQQQAIAVLLELHERAGSPTYDKLAERAELAGTPLGRSTIGTILNGSGSPRTRTIAVFIAACLDYAKHHRKSSQLEVGQATLVYWQQLYDQALGRAARSQASLVRVGVLPRPASAFVPRSIADTMGSALDEGHTVVLMSATPAHTRVLSGLGGVGKSQLAADYARQQWHDPATDVIMWISAASRESILATYVAAVGEILGADTTVPEQAAQRLLSWLSTTTQRWLIVLDDVQVPGDLRGLWPPSTNNGQVLITTRYRGAGLDRPDVQHVDVGVFTPSEARTYLCYRLAHYPHLLGTPTADAEHGELAELAKELGPAIGVGSGNRLHDQHWDICRSIPASTGGSAANAYRLGS